MVGLFFKTVPALCVSAQYLAVCVLVTACGADRRRCTQRPFILSGKGSALKVTPDADTAVSH